VLKVRGGNPIKSGQIVKRDGPPRMIGNIQKTKIKNPSGKRFRPVFRTDKRTSKAKHKNSAAFIDTSLKIQADIENDTIRSGPKNNK
jgi:uncharacterized protein YajQ (UPF0234 family)